ncbi:MAG: NfeD family protein [Pseudomonadota bacterium]|nr:NfeD family protein [Pseudomonadota bacterium]
MTVSAATLWWVLAGLAVVAELATGTFYLLMIALGLIAGALVAHAGLDAAWQLALAALVGAGATALWHWHRLRQPGHEAPAHANRNVVLDIGERVKVTAWAGDKTTQVRYRGSTWSARLAPGAAASSGEHTVAGIEGNWLVLAPTAR